MIIDGPEGPIDTEGGLMISTEFIPGVESDYSMVSDPTPNPIYAGSYYGPGQPQKPLNVIGGGSVPSSLPESIVYTPPVSVSKTNESFWTTGVPNAVYNWWQSLSQVPPGTEVPATPQVQQAGVGGIALLASVPALVSAARSINWSQLGSMVAAGNLVGAARMIIAIVGKSTALKVLGAALGLGLITVGVYNLLRPKVSSASRRRRLTIGANPRLNTLIKVAKHTDKITRKYYSRMRHAGIIRVSTRHSYRRIGRRNGHTRIVQVK